MADKKITDLALMGPAVLDDGDYLVIVDTSTSTTKRTLLSSLKSFVSEAANSAISGLSSTVSGLATTVSNLSSTVTDLGTTSTAQGLAVTALQSASTANATAITALTYTTTILNSGSLAGSRNISLYTTPYRFYRLNPTGSAGISGIPADAVNPPLNVVVQNSPYAGGTLQRYTEPDGTSWTRTWDGTAWSAYEEAGTASGSDVIVITSATSAGQRDADLYNVAGTNYSIDNAGISRGPQGNGTYTADVSLIALGALVHMTWRNSDGSIFTRLWDGSAWSDFVDESPTTSGLATINASALNAGSRSFLYLNAEDTIYTFDGSTSIGTGPFGTALYSGVCWMDRRGDHLVQKFFRTGSDVPYERAYRAGVFDAEWSRGEETLNRKNVVIVGDSITARVGTTTDADSRRNGFTDVFERLTGSYVEFYGVAGAQMSPTTTDSTVKADGSFNRVCAATVSPTTTSTVAPNVSIAAAHTVISFFGANDWNKSTPIGALGDTTETTLYGAMQLGYTSIINLNVSCKVVFMVPLYRAVSGSDGSEELAANSAGHTLTDYRNAIKAFCASKKIQCIDNYSEIGMNSQTILSLTTDGLHPNNAGAKLLAELLQRELA